MNTYTHADLKSISEDVKLAQFLHDIYKWEDDYSISYASRKILWENKLAGKDQDPKWLDKYREGAVQTVQSILRLWSYGYAEVELDAEVSEDVVEQVLQIVCNNLDFRDPKKVTAFCGAVFHGYPKAVRELAFKKPKLTPTELEAVCLCKGIERKGVENVLAKRGISLCPAALETLTTLLNTPMMVRDLLDRGLGKWSERHGDWLPTLIEAVQVPEEAKRVAEAEARGYRPFAARAVAGITYAWDLLEKFVVAIRRDIQNVEQKFQDMHEYEEDKDGEICLFPGRASLIARLAVWGYRSTDGCLKLRKITTRNPWDQKEVKTYYFVRN